MCMKSCSLIKELPEFKAKIIERKVTDAEFARLLADYYALEQQIEMCEKSQVIQDEVALKELRVRCLTLKDRLYMRLKHAE